jgi:acyl carrier protein
VVEAVLLAHPDVQEAAAVVMDGGLAAAVVPVDFASSPAIRDHAWAALGDPAAPRTVTLLAELPRDAAGEVDRAELRRVLTEEDRPTSTYAPPRTEREAEVAEVLREVLDVPRVGLDDDFLELGGDSLRGIEVVNLLRERVGLQVELEDLFDTSTVRDLARDPEP